MYKRSGAFFDWRDNIRDLSHGIIYWCDPYSADIEGPTLVWFEACEYNFWELKDRLTNAPILILQDPNVPYIIYTNTSGPGLGCVLMQGRNVIAYGSRQF